MRFMPLAESMDSTCRIVPNEYALAFAVSLVRSKPAEVSVREYIERLRQHVAKGRRENAVSAAYRHLDRSSYWRSEYERMRTEVETLARSKTDLERELESLRGGLEDAAKESTSKKRKAAGNPSGSKSKASKKTRQSNNAQVDRELDSVPREIESSLSHLGSVGPNLVRCFYRVHMSMNKQNQTEPRTLAFYIVDLAASIRPVAREYIKQTPDQLGAEIDTSLNALRRAMALTFAATQQLSSMEQGGDVQNHCVYSIVRTFTTFLELFREITGTEARQAVSDENCPKTKQTHSNTASKRSRTVFGQKQSLLNMFTQFLTDVLDMLNPEIEVHNLLFEGFSHAVLDVIGPNLYTSAFESVRGDTLEAEIAAVDQASRPSPSDSSISPSFEMRIVQTAAHSLILLLTKVMAAAPRHLGTAITKNFKKLKQTNGLASMKGTLTIAAKERLQRTLVKCVFGTEGTDENDPFVDSLRLPAKSSISLPKPKPSDGDLHDWFKEQVWRLVGWEILAREDG